MAINPRHLISYTPDRFLVNLTVGFTERWETHVFPEDGDKSDLRIDIKNKSVCKINDDMITGLRHGETPVLLKNYATYPGPYILECGVYVYPQEEYDYKYKMFGVTLGLQAAKGVLPNKIECIPIIKHYHLKEEFEKIKRLSGLTELCNLNHSIVFIPKIQNYYDEVEMNGVVNASAKFTFDPYIEAPYASMMIFKYDDEIIESLPYFYNAGTKTASFDIDDLSKRYAVTMGY